jgi:capsular exopolysaccharide synthesis family protein
MSLKSNDLDSSTTAGPCETAAATVALAMWSRPDPIALLRALRRRWGIALAVGLCLAAVAMTVTWLTWPSQYTSFALLRVAAAAPRLVFDTADSKVGGDFATYQRTQVQLIKSRFVLNAALRRPGVADFESVRQQKDPVKWLGDQVNVEYPGGSEILRISMSGDVPSDIATLVNAVQEAYLQEIVNKERDQRLARLNELESIYSGSEEKVRSKRSTYRQLARTLGTSDSQALTHKQQMALEHFSQLKAEQTRLRFDRMRLQVRLSAMKNGSQPANELEIPAALIDAQVEVEPVVQRDLQRVNQLKQLIARYEMLAVDKNTAAIATHRAELESTEKSLAEHRVELRPMVAEQLRTRVRGDLQLTAVEMERQIGSLAEQEKLLQEDIDRYGADVEKIGTSSSDLELLRTEINQMDGIANRIGAEMEALRVELQSPPRITLLQSAEPPQTKDRSRRFKAVGLAAIGSLGLVGFIVAFVEFAKRTVHSANEVLSVLGIRIVGTLPALSQLSRGVLARWRRTANVNENDLMIESVDGVRTMVLHDAGVANFNVVQITSAVSGEGKTTLACNLANSLARAGRRTLLVDCDLRRPTVHKLCELPLGPGFAEVLRGEAGLDQVIRLATNDGLHVITAGSGDRTAVQSLANGELRRIFDALRSEYDFIVVDSCPVLPVADSLAVARHVDAVIVAVMTNVSKLPLVHVTCARLASIGVRLLGAVVSGGRGDLDGYGYGYGYGYTGAGTQPELKAAELAGVAGASQT